MGALGGSARRAKPAPDSPQEDVVVQLMSRGPARSIKQTQTATADAIGRSRSTSTPVYNGGPCPSGQWMQPPNYSARCLGGARFAFVVNERLRLIGYTSCCAARRAPSARRRTARTRPRPEKLRRCTVAVPAARRRNSAASSRRTSSRKSGRRAAMCAWAREQRLVLASSRR